MLDTIAVFDFDGTLRKGESGIEFIYYFLGFKKAIYFFVKNSYKIICYLLKVNDEKILSNLIEQLLKNKAVAEIEKIANQFVIDKLFNNTNKVLIECLGWHQQMKHHCVLLSRSLSFYLKPWAEQMKIDTVIATELAISDGLFTGKLNGTSCNGEEKKKRLLDVFPVAKNTVVYMYGDSQGDIAMLDFANFSYVFSNQQLKPYHKNLFNRKSKGLLILQSLVRSFK